MDYNVGIYERISNEDGDKEESNSIESQRKILHDFIARNEDMRPVKEYADDGYTGTNFNRPAFLEMMEDVKSGVINCIIVKDLSRFGRNYLESGRYLQQILPQYGVRFIAVNDNVDTKDELEKGFDLMLPIRNIFNESYSQDISRKVQSSFKAMQRAGAFCGSHTTYGYRKKDSDKHKLEVEPFAASIVKRIYTMFLEGTGQWTIAQKLNTEGIPCPSEYKRMNGENYRNSKKLPATNYWTYSTVRKILQNEMYTGTMVQNKSVRKMRGKAKARPSEEWIRVPGTHEAIIDPDTWKRVQELLTVRTRQLDLNHNIDLFAGILKCADCGRAMVKHSHVRKSGEKVISYVCGSYTRSGVCVCSRHHIRQSVLEAIVLDDLNTVIANVSDLAALVQQEQKNNHSHNKLGEKELEKSKLQLDKIRRLKREAYSDYKEELLTKEEYLDLRSDYQKQEEYLCNKITSLEEMRKGDSNTLIESEWVHNLLEYKGITTLDRETIIELIDRIDIFEKDEDGSQRLRIYYRFSNELEDLFQTVYTDL